MNGKKSFILYHDMRQPLQLLTDEQRGKLLLALMDYSEFGEIPSFNDSGLSMAFSFIRQQLDRDATEWEVTRQRRAEAGRKGAEVTNGKRRQTSANVGVAESGAAKSAVTDTVTVTVTDNDNYNNGADKPRHKSKFSPPTVEDVNRYAQEAGITLDSDSFVDFYASKAWKVGNAPMKDWKASARNWARREKTSAKNDNTHGIVYHMEDSI